MGEFNPDLYIDPYEKFFERQRAINAEYAQQLKKWKHERETLRKYLESEEFNSDGGT